MGVAHFLFPFQNMPLLNYLTTNQTIAGVKTFSSNISANGVSLGRGAGNNDESVAIGQGAMGSSNSNGKRNTALGAFAMARYNGTAWDNNTSIGYNNLPNMTSGSGNTSVGAESMMSLVTGQENTSIGNQSLISVTGNSNVGVGKRSGQTITSGSQNTILGTDADVSSATLNNATAIGYGAQVTASNAIQLGNSSVTNVKTSGSITAGAGESTIAGTMVVGGSSATGTSAALEVKSTTQGLLLPRLTTAQRDAISSPSQGLLVYNTSTSKFQGYANDAVFGNISAITSQTNSANNGYLSLGSFIMDQSSLVTASQIFTASSITQITSIGVYFSGAGTPGNVTLSVYTGSTIGSGSLLGSIVANVSSIGLKTFTFDGPITVFQGASYYFKLTPALNTNLGLDYDNTAFIDGASYQSQTYGSNPTNNSTISNKSYRFVINGLSGTIASQTNSANNGYLSLSSRPSNSIVTTASQVFALNLKTQLSSVGVYFSGTGGPGVVTLSLYSGSTIGSGTVLGTASTTVSSIGLNNFVFADPIILPPGSYYFKLTPSANTNLGLDYSNSLYSGGASYQNQNSLNNSYRFEINGATATSGWVDLN